MDYLFHYMDFIFKFIWFKIFKHWIIFYILWIYFIIRAQQINISQQIIFRNNLRKDIIDNSYFEHINSENINKLEQDINKKSFNNIKINQKNRINMKNIINIKINLKNQFNI